MKTQFPKKIEAKALKPVPKIEKNDQNKSAKNDLPDDYRGMLNFGTIILALSVWR